MDNKIECLSRNSYRVQWRADLGDKSYRVTTYPGSTHFMIEGWISNRRVRGAKIEASVRALLQWAGEM